MPNNPTPPAPHLVNRADLLAWLAAGGWGHYSPTIVRQWEIHREPNLPPMPFVNGGGQGRPNWYEPPMVGRWLLAREMTIRAGRSVFAPRWIGYGPGGAYRIEPPADASRYHRIRAGMEWAAHRVPRNAEAI